MYQGLDSTISGAGNIFMIISAGTIVSSLLSDRQIHLFGTGTVTAASVATTAAALFGFSSCGAYWQLCLWAIPYGLGAGAVDSALNNYVALHFKARHMSWLHCMWGVGASVGPYIMGLCLTAGRGWQAGYRTIGCIQVVLTAIVLISLPLWKSGSSAETAASYASMFFIGITIGLGCAPVYPCIIHSTPARFGRENSQSLVGLQMAFAYMGSTLMPKLFGVLSDIVNINLFPVWIILLLVLMAIMSEAANKVQKI